MADELVERLRDQNYAGPMQHLRSWSEIDELFNAAAQRIEDVESDYLRRHNDACDRFEQVIELEARIEALERENATLRAERDEARKALEPFAEVVARAGAAAAYFGADHILEVPDSRTFGPMVITWGDLRRAAAIRNMGVKG